ncbi:hypothetical protein LTR28_013651, partial [Elasticomyces elasticus]
MYTRSVFLAGLLALASAAPAPPHKWGNNEDWRAEHGTEGTWKSRIKNVVILAEENRSFDNFCGAFNYRDDIDGLVGRDFCNPMNASMPGSPIVCAKPNAKDIAPDDPPHGISGINYQVFGTFHPPADADMSMEKMNGFVTEQATVFKTDDVNRAVEAIDYFAPEHVRVFEALAKEYVLFDKWYAAVPGPTNPNRAYLTAGTSHGHGRNDKDFTTSSIPVRSIFQQLSEKDISWINYSNTTTFPPDADFYTWTKESGASVTNVKPLTQFYDDAKAGTLPQFSYINPECCSFQSFHPPSATTDGESFIKDVYEALRSSPQWEETLFILTFDEHGGFGDHVPPPVNVPAGDDLTYTETAPDGKNMTFDFKRLGIRVPTILISPFVEKMGVEHEGRNFGKQYTHTSILHTLAKLWDLDILTPRVAWSSTFEHLIGETARKDTLETLPNA